MMKKPLQTFGPNLEGRDFVIGDLHGAFSLFEKLLDHLNFDPLKDRMFSVGDLVDRGPDSLRCLELLYEPWFHAVLSNHEQMMREAFHGGYMGQFWVRNGGVWGLEALNTWHANRSSTVEGARVPNDDEHRLFDLLDRVAELPFIMTVERQDGSKVHIIHAELPPGHTITDEVLADPEKILELATIQSHDGDFFIWGRHIFSRFYKADLSNLDKVKRAVAYDHGRSHVFNEQLSHIISGHTIVQHPVTVMGQTNIDTGAYEAVYEGASPWEALTCLDINEWKFYKVRPSGVAVVEPVVISKEDVEALVDVVRPLPVNTSQGGNLNG